MPAWWQVNRMTEVDLDHCPTGVVGLLSRQAVAGFPSKALTGSYCGDSPSQVPADDAVTLAAPEITATV